MATRTIDPETLNALVGRVVGDFGATIGAALVNIGDRLGLYRAIAEAGPVTSTELAARTGTTERNVREWLAAQAAAGYVTYDGDGRYSLSPEQEEAFTNEGSPAFVCGGFQVVTAAVKSDEKVTEAFRSGQGLGWHEHHHDLFAGTERFFRPGYAASLVDAWLPALDGVVSRLEAGGRVADVGCGHGASTRADGPALPARRRSSASTATLRRSTRRGTPRQRPELPPTRRSRWRRRRRSQAIGYDLVCYFDSLHDMGDPVGALRHARAALGPDGTVMLVEPAAGDCARGQPQSDRTSLLRSVDADLHAELTVPGGRPRPRRPGRHRPPD